MIANKANTNKKTKASMASLISLYNSVRLELKEAEFVMEKIYPSLRELLQVVCGGQNPEAAKRKIQFRQCAYTDGMSECIQVSMDGTVFELTKGDLESLVETFDELNDYVLSEDITDNESILEFVTQDDVNRSLKHFKLLAEERYLRADINEQLLPDFTTSTLDDELRRSARMAIGHGGNDPSSPYLKTTQHRFFIVEPQSDLGKKVLRAKFEQDKDPGQSMLIPDIWHDSYLNFGTIVASICVHFHVINGDFSRVKQCATCHKLFIGQRADKMYCSKQCSKRGWAIEDEHQAYARIKCRERQKQFFNYGEEVVLEWYKKYCDGCLYDPLPPGGQCGRWAEQHGEEEIRRRIEKRRDLA